MTTLRNLGRGSASRWQLTLHPVKNLRFITFAGAFAICACETKNNCENNENCTVDGGAGKSGGANGGTAANGGTTKGGSTKGGSSSTSKAPCNGECSRNTPVCDESTNQCVACLANKDCTTSSKLVCDTDQNVCVACLKSTDCKDTAKPVCDTSTNACVTCLANTDCQGATASRCDTTTNACAACQNDSDCTQISGKNVCSSGACVQCTSAKETACGAYSCNPVTSACTTTNKGSIGKCQWCLADSECIGGDIATPTARCVSMAFNGTTHGNYCLQTAIVGCASPYKVNLSSVSVSGAVATDYCGINQTATTCEAVVDMIASKSCTADSNCGNGQGGLCKNFAVSGAPADLRCTIPCVAASECLAPPVSGSTCTSDVPYCH